MVRAAAGRVNKTSCYAGYEKRVGDLKLDGVLKWAPGGGEHLVEFLCLRNCSGEAIEDEAV